MGAYGVGTEHCSSIFAFQKKHYNANDATPNEVRVCQKFQGLLTSQPFPTHEDSSGGEPLSGHFSE